jgi:hypothetical protein
MVPFIWLSGLAIKHFIKQESVSSIKKLAVSIEIKMGRKGDTVLGRVNHLRKAHHLNNRLQSA